MKDDLPQVHFGTAVDPVDGTDWRTALKDEDDTDDDEELSETPIEVVAMLGFDPKEL